MRETIAKADWLTAFACLAMAWHGMRAAPVAPNEADRFRMQQGQEVGDLARRLYPEGVLIARVNGKTPVQVTQDLLANGAKETFFEATILGPPFVAKADILRREIGGWHVLEVKSSFSDTSSIDELVDDLAYTVMVLKRAGLPVVRASLVLLSRAFRFGNGPERLFEIVDETADCFERAAEFAGVADTVANDLFHEATPTPVLVSACRECAYFDAHCLGSGVAHTVLEIPNLNQKKLKRLSSESIIDLSRIPEDLELNDRQRRAIDATLSGRPIVDPGLGPALAAIEWPCHYLDFETVASVMLLAAVDEPVMRA